MILFYGHFCERSRLNGSSDPQRQRVEVKDETSFGHKHAGISTQVVLLEYGEPGGLKHFLINTTEMGNTKISNQCTVNCKTNENKFNCYKVTNIQKNISK